MPSSPIAVAGSSGGTVFGVVAVPAEDVGMALPLLDLLLGGVAAVLDGVRLADRLGGGAGATRGPTPTVAGVTAAEVITDSTVLPDTEVRATPAGEAGRLSAVVNQTLEIRKMAPVITAITATTAPTATAGATRIP